MTTISHSDLMKNFALWLNKWDNNIVTQDDLETQGILLEKIKNGFLQIDKLLNESDLKVMAKARGHLIPGSNEANEKEVLAMFENQKREWYKNLKKVSKDLGYFYAILENIYEIKNRRTHECFKLRAENAQLREEIRRLRER
ncbi:hypothetical protein [uncultured Chryseobacterium sp.]|uniref:hypothetical protein n=1 Tax=uncultured Chryseobacterium sp. TaxID=259322 RepID=UPI0025FC0EA6|nr:hypothetical protein [uncultured Chryseobacterium sp.]